VALLVTEAVSYRASVNEPAPGPRSPRRPSRPGVIVLAVLFVAVGAVRAWTTWRHSAGIDFYQYWVVGKVLGRGDIPSIYEHGTRAAIGQEFLKYALAGPSARQRAAARFRNVLEPMSTPFLFTALSPFALAAYDTSYDVFLALSLASLLAGAFVLCRMAGLAALDRLVVLALLVFVFEPVAADLRVGNVGELHLGMVALYVWLSAGTGTARQLVAGAVIAAATAFKPSLAAVAPLLLASWALDRRWRRIAAQGAGLVAGSVAALLLSAWLFGSLRAWTDWRTALGGLSPMPIEAGNVSPLAIAERATGVGLGPLPLLLLGSAALAALWMRRRVVPPDAEPSVLGDLPVTAAGCLVFLLSSPLVWLHYLILALPAVVLLLRARPTRQWLAVAGFAAVAMNPFTELLGDADAVVRGLVVVAGLILLFALVLAEIAAPASEEAVARPLDPGAPSREAMGSAG
jgi:hypothetical protein